MAPLSEESVVLAVEGQASCDLAGEAVILQLSSGVYYGLNGVGARVWELLRGPKRIAQIRDAILEEYQVDRETCTRDLLALLDEMREAGLIRVRREPAG